MTTDPISILIVDDSSVVRLGLRALIETEPDLVVCGEAGDGEQALRSCELLQPTVVLLDVRMPRRDGLSVVAELSARSAVVMLTFTDETAVINDALTSGAVGYLVHGTFDGSSLAHMIRSAAAGVGAFSGPALTALRSWASNSGTSGGLRVSDHPLSARQAEVMELIAAGRSNAQIAGQLFLAEKTVKNHINQIFAALNATSRSEAIALWIGTDSRV